MVVWVGLFSFLTMSALLRILASKIEVSDQGFTADRYIGSPKQIDWQDVATVERRSHRVLRTVMGRKTAIRITDGRRGGSIVFTNAISDFPDLTRMIDERVPAARHVRMPLICV